MYKCPKCKTKFTNLNYNFCAACGCDIRDQAEKFINQKIKEMRPHALHGNPQVQFELGDYLQKVKTGGRLREAARWFLAAAEAGDDDAQWRLAACYWAGLGVEMNIETASIWLKQSADQGNAAALCCLAASGGGLSDRQQAFAWTIRAAALGYGWAQYLAGLNYARS